MAGAANPKVYVVIMRYTGDEGSSDSICHLFSSRYRAEMVRDALDRERLQDDPHFFEVEEHELED